MISRDMFAAHAAETGPDAASDLFAIRAVGAVHSATSQRRDRL